jgi:mannan endo-1,4-beta-mannosidase
LESNVFLIEHGAAMRRTVSALVLAVNVVIATAADRYEAENATFDENSVQKVADFKASGGFYINMKEGGLSFKIAAGVAGFYTLWAAYSQPNDTNGKIQNLSVNGVSIGQISFPKVDSFVQVKASSKIKLKAGNNTIDILKSWGWVNIDYVEITPYESVPFNISDTLVTPNASKNAIKMFGFIRENFQKKVISGVMTNTVMQNDGHYTPNTVENQTEAAWVINASGKTPALLGLDFMHAAGMNAENEWHIGYTNATVALAEDMYKKGGFPAYCWHWKDPSHIVDAFYSPSASGQTSTNFNLTKAFTDPATCSNFNTSCAEYQAILRDLDIIAGYLKTLADKGIPVLWRPLHEASGKWFWWGYSGPKACKALYRLMFDRFTKYHGLNNLIWVWTTDEAGDALTWYPGDEYVDIIGRDYYYYPREANHGSLVASFEKLKEMFGGRKVIALSENGSVPFPDEMKGDGAGWSYFMPWYGEYTMDGWAHDNTAADWQKILNNDYVITLDKMPGWNNYIEPIRVILKLRPNKGVSIRVANGFLELTLTNASAEAVELYNIKGTRIATLIKRTPYAGAHRFNLSRIAKGFYLVKVKNINEPRTVGSIIVH